jgi:CheY-like chemotaxis protein
MKEDLHQITQAALRSRTIVRGLLSVVRKHEPRREWVSVNQPIQEVLQLKAYQLHVDNIAVETNLSDELPLTLADPHHLHQVFLNLVNNAHQAMARTHGRGHLTVTSCRNGNEAICVEIADDGPGIPAGLQQRIFEPFFTTKREGTGLGLSIAQGIVQQHGGSISFESQQGLGSRFRVDLPIVTMAEAAHLPQEQVDLPIIAPCYILVVEDEPSVGDFLARVLQRTGHSVQIAANGQEALAMLAGGKPDLIISDVKMPAMRGDQFFTELQVLYPELVSRVIFITGDVADQRTLAFLEESRLPRLVKPFGADELRRVVARMLR